MPQISFEEACPRSFRDDPTRYYRSIRQRLSRPLDVSPAPAVADSCFTLAREILAEIGRYLYWQEPHVRKIQYVTARCFGISFFDLLGPSQAVDMSAPRHLAMLVCSMEGYRFTEMAPLFGRSVSAVSAGVASIARMIEFGDARGDKEPYADLLRRVQKEIQKGEATADE